MQRVSSLQYAVHQHPRAERRIVALSYIQLNAPTTPTFPKVRGPSKLGMVVGHSPLHPPVRAAVRGVVMRALAQMPRSTHARTAHAPAVLMLPSTHGEARLYPGFLRRPD